MNKILVIAPHPDDEVLGCGGTIAKFSKINEVFLCVVTKAYSPEWSRRFIRNRQQEIEKVNKILSIKKTFFLDFPTVKLNTIPQKEINEAISKIIKEVKPDTIFIPHKGDVNSDHRIVFESSLVAVRPNKQKINKVLSYETLSSTEWGQAIDTFIPNIYVDISKTFDKKIKAMKVYKSELKKAPHPRSLEIIEALAKKRGSEIQAKYAEAFMLIREVL